MRKRPTGDSQLGLVNAPDSAYFCATGRQRSPGKTWGRSSVGRALEWHSRGRRFDSARLHQQAPAADRRIQGSGRTGGPPLPPESDADRSGSATRDRAGVATRYLERPGIRQALGPRPLMCSHAKPDNVRMATGSGQIATRQISCCTQIKVLRPVSGRSEFYQGDPGERAVHEGEHRSTERQWHLVAGHTPGSCEPAHRSRIFFDPGPSRRSAAPPGRGGCGRDGCLRPRPGAHSRPMQLA